MIKAYGKGKTYNELITDSSSAEILYKVLRGIRREQALIENNEKHPITDSLTEKPMVYTIEEVCKIIKKKKTTLYNLRKSGKLVPLNTDEKRTKVLYSREAIEKYLGGLKIR